MIHVALVNTLHSSRDVAESDMEKIAPNHNRSTNQSNLFLSYPSVPNFSAWSGYDEPE
jgi:hypothetical protein